MSPGVASGASRGLSAQAREGATAPRGRHKDAASDAFERALRDVGGDPTGDAPPLVGVATEATGAACMSAPPPPLLLRAPETGARHAAQTKIEGEGPVDLAQESVRPAGMSAPEAPRSAAGHTPEPMSPALRAAFESAWTGMTAGLPGGSDPAQAAGHWEVSIDEPLSIPVELLARRTDAARRPDGLAGWQFTVKTHGLDGSALARHASRLDARLRERGLGTTHLRIDEHDGADSE